MSQSDEWQEEIQVLKIIQTTSCVDYSVACVVLYEFIITFDQEVAVVWKRKFTATSLLLLGIRWLMILSPLSEIIPWPLSWCSPTYVLNTVLYIVGTALLAVFSALRVYALWQGSRLKYLLTGAVLILAVVPVGTNIFGLLHTVALNEYIPPVVVCTDYLDVPEKLNEDLLYFTRSSAIAADVLVLVLTWAKSFRQFREMQRLRLTSSVTTVLLRDGTVYFIALLVMNILLLVTFTASGLSAGGDIATFLLAMPPVLVQRFMLNLRQLNTTVDSSDVYTRAVTRSSVDFAAPASDFLGNIGAPLDHSGSMLEYASSAYNQGVLAEDGCALEHAEGVHGSPDTEKDPGSTSSDRDIPGPSDCVPNLAI